MFCNGTPTHLDARALPSASSGLLSAHILRACVAYELVVQAVNAKIKVIGQKFDFFELFTENMLFACADKRFYTNFLGLRTIF